LGAAKSIAEGKNCTTNKQTEETGQKLLLLKEEGRAIAREKKSESAMRDDQTGELN